MTFNKSKLFRNYKKLNMFLYEFATFENNIYKLNKFRFRTEFYKRLNFEGIYKYYGLCINGNFNNILTWIYNKIKNDSVQHSDDEKHMIIYPNTFLSNDFITKIYTCVRMKKPQNEYYLKL